MAIRSREAAVRLSKSTDATAFRQLVATADVQDTAAGVSVLIRLTRTDAAGTLGAPADWNSATLSLHVDNTATQIRAYAVTPADLATPREFHFTADGTAAAAIRAGLLRLRVRMVNSTAPLSADRYDVNSDNGSYGTTGSTVATGTAVTVADPGYVRGVTTAVTTLDRESYGYPDTVTATTVLGAAPYKSQTVTVKLGDRVAVTGGQSATDTFTAPLAAKVDTSFPAAAQVFATTTTFPNAALLATPWTTATLTEDSAMFDPRITVTPLFQLEDDMFGVPPLSKHQPTMRRLTTQGGYVAARYTNARGEGVNGLTITRTLAPTKPGESVVSTGVVTGTQGGQDGWTVLLPWTSQLPGGRWVKTVDVTAPADIAADGYLIGATVDHFLAAVDPNITVVGIVGGHARGRHVTPGDLLLIGAQLQDTAPGETDRMLFADTDSAGPLVFALIFRPNAAGTGADFLDGDMTWKPNIVAGARVEVFRHRIPPIPDSGEQFFRLVIPGSVTAVWDASDVEVIVRAVREGAAYTTVLGRELTATFQPHDQEAGVKPEDHAAIADAVWNELSAEQRAAGSFGLLLAQRLDAAVSTRATPGDIPVDYVRATDVRLDLLDAAVSSRATHAEALADPAGVTALLERITATRAALLDALALLDVAVSTRATPADATHDPVTIYGGRLQ